MDAPSNEVVDKFSIELGVLAGVHITTLPVIPASRLEQAEDSITSATGATADVATERAPPASSM